MKIRFCTAQFVIAVFRLFQVEIPEVVHSSINNGDNNVVCYLDSLVNSGCGHSPQNQPLICWHFSMKGYNAENTRRI